MKELSIEAKATLYDKALERASKLRVQNPFDTVSQMIEHVFPELREESKDERIRKELISIVTWSTSYSASGVTKEDADNLIAWLEKQGEQKPTDKVEPKFHEGEWNDI